MDIRNFFGGGGGGAKKAPSSSKKSEKPKPKPAAKKKQEKSAAKVTNPKTEEKKVAKKPIKKKVIDLSDSEDDVDMVEISTTSTKQKDPPKAPTSSGDAKAPKRKEPEATVKKAATPKKKEVKPESDKEEEKPSPAKKRRTTTTTPKKKKEPAAVPPKPTEAIESYPDPSSGIFDGYTFVFTGVLSNLSRDDAIDYVKSYGGRVTTAVSGKTSYLVIGDELEDGRPVEEGSKFKKATELGKVVILKNEGDLYGLAKLLDEKKKALNPKVESSSEEQIGNVAAAPAVANPYAKKSAVVNPYTKPSGTISNPYAKSSSGAVSNPYAKTSGGVSNPYAKSAAPSNPYASKSSTANPYAAKAQNSQNSCHGGGRADISDASALWADKYAPSNTNMILGNKEAVSKLRRWLDTWESTFNKPSTGKKKKPSFNSKNGPFKAALLSGPPGIGKTTTAQLVIEEAGRQVFELNASDARSKKMLESSLGDITGSQVLSFQTKGKKNGSKSQVTKRCIIMDEVDGMSSGDRGGMAEVIKMIKNSMVPIICICNDRQSQKIKSLVPYCLDLKYRRPVKSMIARRAIEVGKAEGMEIEYNAAEAVSESCGNDIRQVLNCLQMWGNKRHSSTNKRVDMTYKDFKNRDNLINKDEMLRVTLFDAARMICEGRRGLSEADETAQRASFFKRTDAFFNDYALMGLLVHQNYLKVAVKPYLTAKASGDPQTEYESLVSMCEGTEAMSDFAVAEHGVRSGDQNWGLLPLCSVLTVKGGFHVGGENGGFLPGYPEFSAWLGKNSSRGKHDRLLQELGHHMNYKISADKTELRLGYLPMIRQRLVDLMMPSDGSEPNVEEAIAFMDEYGLDRDDLFENIDEFVMDDAKKFADIDSKSKSAFTREYNKSVHKSQALIEEQGVATRKRKKANDDEEEGENDADSDQELSPEEIAKMFGSKKKGKKTSASKKGKKS